MPVPAQVDVVVGYNHQVEHPRRNGLLAARAEVLLSRLVGLDRSDGHVERIAHAITPIVASSASTTMTTSSAVLSCSRKGLKPTPRRYLPAAIV